MVLKPGWGFKRVPQLSPTFVLPPFGCLSPTLVAVP